VDVDVADILQASELRDEFRLDVVSATERHLPVDLDVDFDLEIGPVVKHRQVVNPLDGRMRPQRVDDALSVPRGRRRADQRYVTFSRAISTP